MSDPFTIPPYLIDDRFGFCRTLFTDQRLYMITSMLDESLIDDRNYVGSLVTKISGVDESLIPGYHHQKDRGWITVHKLSSPVPTWIGVHQNHLLRIKDKSHLVECILKYTPQGEMNVAQSS